jgi:DNA ligase (NAD+)
LTPLALLEPVELAGVTVRKATLNNYGDILRKDVKIGSRVLIRRSNEVIPEILGATEHLKDSKEVEKPTVCPACGGTLIESGALLFCPNRDCRPRIAAKLDHYASKNAMDIDGFSESTAYLLIDKKGVRNFSDLYRLTENDLSDLDGFKEKKIKNLLTAIEKSKHVTLDSFIYALGIDGIGRVAARDLSKHFKNMQALTKASYDELIGLENIGDITAKNIIDHFADEENEAELDRLFACGVQPKEEEQPQGGVFFGQMVVLTGTLPHYKRSEAQKIIEAAGGVCQSGVTAKTTLVLAGDDAGSKLEKAQKAGIKIIDEAEFEQMIGKGE